MRFVLLGVVFCSCVSTCVGTALGGPDVDGGMDAGVDAGPPTEDAGAPDASVPDGGVDGGLADAGAPDAGPADAGPPDGGDLCATALLCEQFDTYDAGPVTNGGNFGNWRANVQDSSATAAIDGLHTTSGTGAFHVHIDQGASSGAQIKTHNAPLFASTRQQLYGRFMMYLGPDGTSNHWTMWGASGTVPQGTTSAGANATYLFSAFDNGSGKNIFSDVYGNSVTGQDCYNGSSQLMPVSQWACVAWSIDATARTYRMSLNGTHVPSMDINDEGMGCVTPPNQSWWGPDFDELYIGALSFHPMTGPLDLWIDDLIVDTSPVSCP